MNAFAESTDERRKVIGAIADMLPKLNSPTGAGLLAIWLGAAVERGEDPERTCHPIIETFLRWSRTVEPPCTMKLVTTMIPNLMRKR
jgi:hypothetical protein